MYYGVNIPPFEHLADARKLADWAHEAEEAGWDGFFLWDHILFWDLWLAIADPWVALAAVAMNTRSIRLGTMVTALARRRPWKLARETVSIDHLSGGRLILGVGLGFPPEWEFGAFGEETDAKVRAQKLDEGLEILTGLWSGEPFSFSGQHYHVQEMVFLPRPVQSPRIPIWVGGYWPAKGPMRRAARWDGSCAGGLDGPLTPEDWRKVLRYIREHRTREGPFEAVHGGVTRGDDRAKAEDVVAPYAEAGVTWWIEDVSPYGLGMGWAERWTVEVVERMRQRIRQGPPRIT